MLGLGEAGGLFATGLVQAGAVVRGYDPRVEATAASSTTPTPRRPARARDLVLSVNSAADALDALAQGLPGARPDDLGRPQHRRPGGEAGGGRRRRRPDLRVVDVAIMAPVPAAGAAHPHDGERSGTRRRSPTPCAAFGATSR